MVAKYDIFKKTNDSVVWVETVEDIVTAKKRLNPSEIFGDGEIAAYQFLQAS